MLEQITEGGGAPLLNFFFYLSANFK